ncbi:MAG: hypothetical protein GY830_10115 [Bacteroidetes bacterium]|nr:hypothetical protein [Bacteroidota bacterium]
MLRNFIFTIMFAFALINISKAEDTQNEQQEEFDRFGFGITSGLGGSISNNQKALEEDGTDTLALVFRAGAFAEYNFIKYLGIQLGGMYTMLPIKNTEKGGGSSTLTFHNFSLPIKLKLYPFGVQSGFSLCLIGIEPMFRGHISFAETDKNGKSKENTSDKTKKEMKENLNSFFLGLCGCLEYEIKSIGLILSLTGGTSLPMVTGLFANETFKKMKENNKNIYQPTFTYITFNIGYNFASIF